MRRFLWFALGVGLVVAGVLVALDAPSGPYDAGWFAYTPLGDSPDWYMEWDDGQGGSASAAVVLTRQHVVGYGVIALGVLVLVAGAAYLLGRRRAGSTPASER